MQTEEFRIEGMSCGHCVASVTKALAKLPRITIDEVRIGAARVTYDGAASTRAEIMKAIGDAGFTLLAP